MKDCGGAKRGNKREKREADKREEGGDERAEEWWFGGRSRERERKGGGAWIVKEGREKGGEKGMWGEGEGGTWMMGLENVGGCGWVLVELAEIDRTALVSISSCDGNWRQEY